MKNGSFEPGPKAQYDATKRLDLTGPAFSGLSEHGLYELGVSATNWLAVWALLGNLLGTLRTRRGLVGCWAVESRVPQGGALSLCILTLVLIPYGPKVWLDYS